ncbi:SLC13 family permease [Chlorogloeopsis sp. ULAP01]|uniref:SLC13 family permease n=1 Tax=Chlorogloeopsis sp. ULAP01 TaxID=3056483 RepID=UPI0025AA433D|nr:SLC13 family permease [Chlorogloeopsis sp. ULAP01]MDM9383143.1 SLC13 family permease [Chlorogloeopsis sp. ULAP01]
MTKASASKSVSRQTESDKASLWSRFDTKRLQQVTPTALGTQHQAAGKKTKKRKFRWVVDAVLPLALTTIASIAVLLPSSLPHPARLALFAFLLAAILWSTTSISADYIALFTMMLLVLVGGISQEQLFDALASDVVWLMIGAFVLGGAVQKTGLAGRLTQLVVSRAKTVKGVFWLLVTVLIPMSFLIPSTSGRAAVAIPVFRSITSATSDRRIIRALALLMPTIILVSTIVALVGAGSHLIANDLLQQITKERISFTEWVIYGLPFGVVASYASCWVIMRLFLDQERLNQELHIPQGKGKPLSRSEGITLIVVGIMIALWLTESWHGFEIATVTVVGALILTLPGIGVLKWKEGLKSVSWNLVIFVGAALVLGRALIDSGAAQWIIDQLFTISSIASTNSRSLILVSLAFISLTSHIYMTSHTARAAALVPALLYLGNSLQLNPVAVMFISTVGMDYCLTFPVSSKALLMFQELEGETYKPTDLLRLSSVLLPVHLGLMVLFYYSYWRWVGLTL